MDSTSQTHEGVGSTERKEHRGDRPPFQDAEVDSSIGSKLRKSISGPTSIDILDHTTTIGPSQHTEAEAANIDNINDTPVLQDESTYITGAKLYIVSLALYLAVFVVTLDRSIIATAIPKITSDFHSLDNFTWYQSGFQLASSAFQLSYGNIYSMFSVKWTFLTALTMFEIGSVICGVAPNSIALIFGRVVAGLGTGGIYIGALVIISLSVPVHNRPVYTGIIGAISGIATISGPVIGGVLTQDLSWLWCFYINYPLGAITLVVVWFLLETPPSQRASLPFSEKCRQFDLLGTLIFIPSIVCLFLALEWGGTTYAWSSWRIILLFVLFAISISTWAVIQWKKGELAMFSFRIIRNRAVAWGFYLSFLNGSVLILLTYYIPIYFQAVKNVDATQSGVDYIPSALSSSIFSVIGGFSTRKFGYLNPGLYLSTTLMSVGIGLIYTFQVNSPSSFWIGAQIPYGAGVGLGIQQPLMALQNVLSNDDMPTGFSTLLFAQTMGGATFVTVGQTVFNNKLRSGLTTEVPDLNPELVLNAGAGNLTATIQAIDPAFVHGVLVAYMDAVKNVILIALVLAVMTCVGSVAMPWIKLKGKNSREDEMAEKKQTKEDGGKV